MGTIMHLHAKILPKLVQMVMRHNILLFSLSDYWPPCLISKRANFYSKNGSGGPRHVTLPILLKLNHTSQRYCDFWTFKNGSRRRLGFLTSADEVQRRLIIMPNFVEFGQSVAEILRFFVFFNMAPFAILDLFGAYLDSPRRVLDNLYHCTKFGYNRCSGFDNMNVSIFGAFGWKTPIYAPQIGVNRLQY